MDMKERVNEAAPWYWIGAIWFGLGLFEATQNVVVMRAEGMHHAWFNLFLLLLLSWLPWALATPAVMRLGSRHPLLPARAPGAWLRHGSAWLLIGLAATGWSACLQVLLNPWTPDAPPGPLASLWFEKFTNQLLSSLVLYGCILMAGHLLVSRERLAQQRVDAARLGEQLSRAELAALRHQIEPHFLFNALNAVASLIRTGRSEPAVEMIALLSDFLRHSLQQSSQQQVPLSEELRFTQMYLGIQSIRFADRLKVQVSVSDDLGQVPVPGLILQPIVENAIKHGISRRSQGGLIDISASQSGDDLRITVYNDGPGMDRDPEANRRAIGLSNVRERLLGLYGTKASMRIANQGDAGVLVTLSMPMRS